MRGFKQIIIFFFGAGAFCGVYFSFLYYCVHFTDVPILQNNEMWVRDVLRVKDIINAKPTSKQRVLVIGDSGALFGFNGAMIELNTNYTFINYGSNYNIPLNYQVDKIISSAREGDIWILPLEFEYYTRDNPKDTLWYLQNMVRWGGEYHKYIDTRRVLLAYIQNDPIKLFSRVRKYYRQKPKPAKSVDEIIAQENPMIEELNDFATKDGIIVVPCANPEWSGYSYESLTPDGDWCAQKRKSQMNNKSPYIDEKAKVSTFFLDEHKRLKKFADSHNIKIFLFYPPTVENPQFKIDDPKTLKKIENLTAQLAKHDIKIHGDFRDTHFDRKYFFDSRYHLNSDGADLRTIAFIKQMREILADETNGAR